MLMTRKWRLAFAALVLIALPAGAEDALVEAAKRGDAETVRVLLTTGADINRKDDNGATALMRAARNGKAEAVQILLEAGVNIHARTHGGKGNSALDIAKEHKRIEVIVLLEQAGAK